MIIVKAVRKKFGIAIKCSECECRSRDMWLLKGKVEDKIVCNSCAEGLGIRNDSKVKR